MSRDVVRSGGAGSRGDGALIVCSALGAGVLVLSFLFLVLVRAEVAREGYRTHDLRTELVDLRQRAADLRVERSQLLRPARIAQLARDMGLDAPTQDQQLSLQPEAP